MKDLKVREIFYSIQGEGSRQGEPSIFIRLAECNLNCWFCDTDWSYGLMMTIEEIRTQIKEFPCDWIVWTGGEPTMQLTDDILAHFPDYHHAIETNGTNKVPSGIDYITCSPKIEVHPMTLYENFPDGVNEFRYPFEPSREIPNLDAIPRADHYFISPLFLGEEKKRFKLDMYNVKHAIEFIKNNKPWKLSLQIHKLIDER